MRNLIKNQKVVDSLPDLKNEGYKHAYLIIESNNNTPKPASSTGSTSSTSSTGSTKARKDAISKKLNDGSPLVEFLYNPESISISMPVNYADVGIPYTETPQVFYVNGGSQTLTISDIYLDTWDDKKSLQPILDRLTDLRKPIKQNGVMRSPEILYFKWGQYSSFPCVLTQLDYNITHRINGYPVRAKLNLVFKEVPNTINRVTSAVNVPITPVTQNNALPKPLTKKQTVDGITQVIKNGLNGLRNLLPSTTKSIKTSDLKINNHTGEIFYSKSSTDTKLGVYNGDRFTPDSTNNQKNYNIT
jgi:hypothetical protein